MSHSLHHTDAADTAKLLQELDRDSKSRSLTGGYKTAMTVLFVLYSLTMIVMALVVSGATQYTRLPVFVGMTLFVGYLKYPASKKDALRDNYFPWYDVILAFTSLGVFFYYAIEQKRIIQMANRIGTTQIVLGIIGILLLVELCRRSTGIPLIVVVGLFTVYGAWWLTNNNPKTALRNLIYNLFYNLNCGIFSSPITVCASFIVLFIILGSFLEKTGIGTFFVDLANSIAGASVGGPAKVAVISSALEGMYSGSSVANTVGSGSITIPTMKRWAISRNLPQRWRPPLPPAVRSCRPSWVPPLSSWRRSPASPMLPSSLPPSCPPFCTSPASSLWCILRASGWGSRACPRTPSPTSSACWQKAAICSFRSSSSSSA